MVAGGEVDGSISFFKESAERNASPGSEAENSGMISPKIDQSNSLNAASFSMDREARYIKSPKNANTKKLET